MHRFGFKKSFSQLEKSSSATDVGLEFAIEDDDVVGQEKRRWDETRTWTTELSHRIQKYCRSTSSNIEDGKRISSTMNGLCSKILMHDSDCPLVELLERTRDFQLNYEELRARMTTKIETDAAKVIDQLKEDSKPTKSSIKKYDTARKQYESAVANAKQVQLQTRNPEKNEAAIKQRDDAKLKYETVSAEVMIGLKDINKGMELALMESLVDYWECYQEMVFKTYKWLDNVKPILEKTKQQLSKNKAQHEQEMKERQEMMERDGFQPLQQTKVFGVSLEQLALRPDSVRGIPHFLQAAISFVKTHAKTEGLFRVSAAKEAQNNVKMKINQGKKVDFKKEVRDPHLVAGLVKIFLRELPEPLMTFELYREFIVANKLSDNQSRVEKLRDLNSRLPPANRAVMKLLMEVLSHITQFQEFNKMGASNLSTVIGPNILYAESSDPLSMVEDMQAANSIIVILITQYKSIFRCESVLAAAEEGCLADIQELFSEGGSLTTPDADGRTPLHVAAGCEQEEVVQWLLDQDIDVDAVDKRGRTALHYAVGGKEVHQELCTMLVQAGASPETADGLGKTPLELAKQISPELCDIMTTAASEKKSAIVRVEAPAHPEVAASPELRVKSWDKSSPSRSELIGNRSAPQKTEPDASELLSQQQAELDEQKRKLEEEIAMRQKELEEKEKKMAEEQQKKLDLMAKEREDELRKKENELKKKEEEFRMKELEERKRRIMEAEANRKRDLEEQQQRHSEVTEEKKAESALHTEGDVEITRIVSLQSLISEDVPLLSVYKLVDVNAIATAGLNMAKEACSDKFTIAEISRLNDALRSLAGAVKALFAVIKQFAALFGEKDKKDILSDAVQLQELSKGIINAVKLINQNPTEAKYQEDLRAAVKQFIDTVFKFYKACENASVQYVLKTGQECAEGLTMLLNAATKGSQEDLDKGINQCALSTVKLLQLLKAKSARTTSQRIRNALSASCELIEQNTLDIINEARTIAALGGKGAVGLLTSVAKKLLLEYRNVNELAKADSGEMSIPSDEQIAMCVDNHKKLTEMHNSFEGIRLSELDRKLVQQLSALREQVGSIKNLPSLSTQEKLGISLEISETVGKIKEAVVQLKNTSRDPSLQIRLRVLADTLQNVCMTLKLAASADVLRMQITAEVPLAVQIDLACSQCAEFFKQLHAMY